MTSGSWLSKAAVVAALVLLTAAVSAAASLTVTVVDKESGAPLAKAVVAVVSGESLVAAGRTNEQGSWTHTVAAGQLHVTTSKRLYASATSQKITFAADDARQLRFELPKHEPADFKRFGRIVGFVRDATGKPVGSATLVLLKGNPPVPVGAAQSEKTTGLYELEWYPPGAYTVIATATGYRLARRPGQTIAAAESLWLDVKLDPE